MKYAFLVARREFLENVRTKGFWVGMFLFPAMLVLFGMVPRFLEKTATPTRYFVLVDQTGEFEGIIRTQIQRLHQRRLLRALTEHTTKWTKIPAGNRAASQPDLEKLPAPSPGPEKLLDEFAENNPQALEQFEKVGGKDFVLAKLQPFLRADAPAFREPKLLYQRVELPAGVNGQGSLSEIAEQLKPYLRGDKRIAGEGRAETLFAAILLPRDLTNRVVRPHLTSLWDANRRSGLQYWAVNLADQGLPDEIERGVNAEIRRREYIGRGMDPSAVSSVERTSVAMAKLNPKKEAGKEAVSMADYIRQWMPSGFVYLLWVAIFSVSQMLLNNTIEEKSNRIIEVLLSSVTPGELMMGKLAGIAAVGLTMVVSWVVMLLGFLLYKAGPEAEMTRQILQVLRHSSLLPAFLIYFLLGYLMYAGLFLSIGSVCNTIKEAQNYMGVVMMILMVPLMTMVYIPKDPNGTLATVLSWIPLYTPFVMMNRATADPPTFEVVGTIVVLAASTLGMLWLSGRIFRVGILRTGQPPRLFEMLKWLRGI